MEGLGAFYCCTAHCSAQVHRCMNVKSQTNSDSYWNGRDEQPAANQRGKKRRARTGVFTARARLATYQYVIENTCLLLAWRIAARGRHLLLNRYKTRTGLDRGRCEEDTTKPTERRRKTAERSSRLLTLNQLFTDVMGKPQTPLFRFVVDLLDNKSCDKPYNILTCWAAVDF